ncbi:MAG: penicillin-binding transpeptidase domain-containing protein, partial [Catalinimonas sp.]
ERSLNRRNVVMSQMVKYELLDQAAYDTLKTQPIEVDFQAEDHNEGLATYYREYIKPSLVRWARENGYDLYADGLRFHTSLDANLQQYAEEAMIEHMRYQQAIFFQQWKGRNPWVNDEGREIPGFLDRMIRQTPQYRALVAQYGKQSDSVDYFMNKPMRTELFSWNNPELAVDTMISPIDSLKHVKHYLHAGLMAMDPRSGEIRAWVGGINHRFFKYDHVKQGARQPGSTFKAAVYAAAIDNGYTPCHPVWDNPTVFYLPDGTEYIPQNSSGEFSGDQLTLRQGLAQSKNSVSSYLVRRLGPQMVVDYAKRLGITTPIDAVPSLALGTSDVSVYDITGMYSTFVNQGTWTQPHSLLRIEDRQGRVLQTFTPEVRDALSPQTAYTMVHMLRGTTQEKNGTALGLWSRSKVLTDGNQVAAKTGTTDNYSDGWFVGATKDLVTSVWVGAEERSIHFRSFAYGQGARMAMPIWYKFMDKAYADATTGLTKGPFPVPDGYTFDFNCDDVTGAAPGNGSPVSADPEAEETPTDDDTYVQPRRQEFE